MKLMYRPPELPEAGQSCETTLDASERGDGLDRQLGHADGAPRCYTVATFRCPGAGRFRRKCLEALEPTSGLEPLTC